MRLWISRLSSRRRHNGGRRTDRTDFVTHFLIDALQRLELARQLVDFFIPLGELFLKHLNVGSLHGAFRHILFPSHAIFAVTFSGQLPLELIERLGIRILAGSKLLDHHFPVKQVSHQAIGCLAHCHLTLRYGRSRDDGGEPCPLRRRRILLYLLEPESARSRELALWSHRNHLFEVLRCNVPALIQPYERTGKICMVTGIMFLTLSSDGILLFPELI